MNIKEHKQEAFEKALNSLARYKFIMFGYWAAIWVHLNQIDDDKEPNPFKELVQKAREMKNIRSGYASKNAQPLKRRYLYELI